MGNFRDVMVETADGHRVLLAPNDEVAQYVSSTYTFDEVRVHDLDLQRDGASVRIASDRLTLQFRIGSRPLLGAALQVVPSRLARARWWTTSIDPIARTVLPGVRTRGSAGNGRREWYAALDLHRLKSLSGSFDGTDLGQLTVIEPAVRFGFGSVPAKPSIVRVVTTVSLPAPATSK